MNAHDRVEEQVGKDAGGQMDGGTGGKYNGLTGRKTDKWARSK